MAIRLNVALAAFLVCIETAMAQVTTDQIAAKWADVKRTEDESSFSSRISYIYRFPTRKNAVVWQVSKSGQCGRLISVDSSVIGWNEKYTFVLKRNKESHELSLTTCEEGAPATNELLAAFLRNNVEGYAIYPRSWFFRDSLTAALAIKTLELIDCRLLENGLVRIDIKYILPGNGFSYTYIGTLDVDPQRDFLWVAAEMDCSDVKVASGENLKVKWNREVHPGGRISAFHEENNATDTQHMIYEYRDEILPPEQYRLTAFGMPEPAGVKWDKPTPRYIWFLVAGLAFLLLGAIGRWAYARRARSHPATAP